MSIKKGDLGNAIRTARIKKGYTQEEVANRLHVAKQTFQNGRKTIRFQILKYL